MSKSATYKGFVILLRSHKGVESIYSLPGMRGPSMFDTPESADDMISQISKLPEFKKNVAVAESAPAIVHVFLESPELRLKVFESE